MIILDDISDTLWQIPIWQIPSSQNIQLTHTLLLLVYFTYIAARYIKDEIVIQKQNVFEGVILILLACALKIFETGHLGTVALCFFLYFASTRYRYKPLSTEGKAILITGRWSIHNWFCLFVCLFCCFTSQAMAMAGRSVHLTTLFFLGKLEQAVNQYFVHIISLVTDNNPSWISRREENDRKNCFIINLHESKWPGRDRTSYPWICSETRICYQTLYKLRYVARYSITDEKINKKNTALLKQHFKGFIEV